ncbi:conserved membrane protein of unknown function [Tenacibaculum sp. 190130A14a]|uniref:Uncharacterized protein n=1 Tax=Tenacibaculum polynesiense TaxID=3137857 RepID=A0ABM9P6N3_9FLAO
MKRRTIEILFIIIITLLSIILFRTTVIYKHNLFEHPFTFPLFGIISIGFLFFNYQVLQLKWIKNILYSMPVIVVSFILSLLINGLIISLMLKLDQGKTALGWTYNYRWFTILIFGILLIISTELIGIRISKKHTK